MRKKLWSGRFDKQMAPEVERFSASVGFDRRLFEYDIMGSLAHVEMLARAGLISKTELQRICSGLKRVREDLRKGAFRPGPGDEDIHMAVESRLKKLIGPVADKLHTGRSRNDQIALDLRLYLRDEIGAIVSCIRRLQKALVSVAWRNKDVVIPGLTHLQHAQPVLAAHHLLAYVEMLDRDAGRLLDCLVRVNTMPLGAGALAGSSLPIDREYVAKRLGFRALCGNSMDAVSDRDFAIEFLAAGAVIGVHLSRMAEEIVLWASREFSFIEIDLSYCSGSSLMPQKANPDVAELVRAKSGRLFGALMSLLTVMKGLPLAYNRDLQEDKEPVFDAVETLKGCLSIMAGLWGRIEFRGVAIGRSIDGDFSQAADLAEYLVTKGCAFRKAHHIVGKLVADCIRHKKTLDALTVTELRKHSRLFDKGAVRLLRHSECVGRKKSKGSTSHREVLRALKMWKKKLRKHNA
jgi:argininosuccinate lyase